MGGVAPVSIVHVKNESNQVNVNTIGIDPLNDDTTKKAAGAGETKRRVLNETCVAVGPR